MQLCCIGALLLSQVSRKWVNWLLTVVISPRDDCSRARASLRRHCCCTNLDLIHTHKEYNLVLKNTTYLHYTALVQENNTGSGKWQYGNKMARRKEKRKVEKKRDYMRCLSWFWREARRRNDEKRRDEAFEFYLKRRDKTRWRKIEKKHSMLMRKEEIKHFSSF